ncbi:reverse transcriptase domain-containing protein [Tanacetum coccineum]
MRTRSQARKRRQQQVRQNSVESPNLEKPNNNQEIFNPPIVTMDDNRTMAQLLEAPTEGYEDAIVVPEINANNFEIKHGLLNLVQNKQNPHAHIRYFNKITSTMKIPNVPNTSVKLMLFPFSLEGAARIWLEKEPPRSIETWDDLVSKFINKFFPPSKTTNLINEITIFQQKIDETFYEAWDRFNDFLRGCPHHGFSELQNDSDCLKIIESKSKVRQSRSKAVIAKMSTSSSTPAISSDVAELKDMVRALILDRKNQTPVSAPVKAVEQSCVTCGGASTYGSGIFMVKLLPTQGRFKRLKLPIRVGKRHNFQPDQTSRYTANFNHMTANRIDVIDMASEEYSQEVLANAFLALDDDTTSPEVDPTYYDPDGDILILEAFLNNEPPTPIPNQGDCSPETQEEIKLCEAKTVKSSIDKPTRIKFGEKADLIKVLKSHKRAIAWKLSDIQGINPEFCTHKILMEEDYKPAVQHQRRAYANAPGTDVPKEMLQRCEDTTLCLTLGERAFYGQRGHCQSAIHKISKNGIEVDKAKIDVIAKLPHPTTVKGPSPEPPPVNGSQRRHQTVPRTSTRRTTGDHCQSVADSPHEPHWSENRLSWSGSGFGSWASQSGLGRGPGSGLDRVGSGSGPRRGATCQLTWQLTWRGGDKPSCDSNPRPLAGQGRATEKYKVGKLNRRLKLRLISHFSQGTDISQKDEKPSKNRQNRTRDGKVCENEAKSKSSQLREEKKAEKNIT